MNYDSMHLSELIDTFQMFARKIDLKIFDVEFYDADRDASLKAVNYYKKEMEKINDSLFVRFGLRI